jgi:hypothetical protein
MARTWIAEHIGQVLELSDALIRRKLPDGVSYKGAELRHAEMKVELYEAMAEERPESREVEQQLAEARRRLDELTEHQSGNQG